MTGYRRDRLGRWRYESTGSYVPNAKDATLNRSWNFERTNDAILVPVAAMIFDEQLHWCRVYLAAQRNPRGNPDVITIPIQDWEDHANETIGIDAPELAPSRLVDISRLATALAIRPATIRAYVTRGQFPAPNVTGFGSPMWSVPVIVEHLRARRRAAEPPAPRRRPKRTGANPRALHDIDEALAQIEASLARLGITGDDDQDDDEFLDEPEPTFDDRYRVD